MIDRNKCGYGTTGKSTAKITYLQEDIYGKIKDTLGEKIAQEYLKSQICAVELIQDIVEEYKIDCDFRKVSSYIFTNKNENIKLIQNEYEFLKDRKVEAGLVKEVPFNEECKLAIKVGDTYTFNPLKYIDYFKKLYQSQIYENSKLESFRKVNDYYECLVNGKIVKCKYLVIATHYPYFLKNVMLPIKSYIETSFIGAKKVKEEKLISAINVDNPTISLRYYQNKDINYLIYLLNSKKSANIEDFKTYFKDLKDKGGFTYLWTNNDIITNDYMPLIGTIDKDNSLIIATGYNTWGFTNGTMAGLVIKDTILNNYNPFISLFKPKRGINFKKLKRGLEDGYGNIKAIVKSNNNVNNKNIVGKTIDGKKVWIYKDDMGKEHIVLSKCPHLKCGIVFNETEKTWECLCHGSRFDIDGKCINGPSNYDITFK